MSNDCLHYVWFADTVVLAECIVCQKNQALSLQNRESVLNV